MNELSDEIRIQRGHKAVANGPVRPAMAGPIIEPEIKKMNFVILCFIFFWANYQNYLVGIINARVSFC